MRKLSLFILSVVIFFSSCINVFNKTINGNGNITTEQRSINNAERIKSSGSFDVLVIQGSSPSVKVEADENLLPYIITQMEDGALVIRPKEHYNVRSDNKIKITVTTSQLEEVEVNGSGNLKGEGKFAGSDHLKVSISGSGDISLDVNTPNINSDIAGSGNITLSGETRNSKISIAGDGDYNAEDLKSEEVEIHIAGSGNTKVYAENKLDIHIAGSGDVSYKGNATVSQDIAGSGKIVKVD